MPSEEQTRNANEARVKLAKEMVGYAKGRGWDMNELRAMAGTSLDPDLVEARPPREHGTLDLQAIRARTLGDLTEYG